MPILPAQLGHFTFASPNPKNGRRDIGQVGSTALEQSDQRETVEEQVE